VAKVLILEDEEIVANLLLTLVGKAGGLGVKASTVAEAWELLESEPDIEALIVDHHLGIGESGVEFLREVRMSMKYRHLPAIVCSGDTKRDAVNDFVNLDIAAFVAKPFPPDRIIREVFRLLETCEATIRRANLRGAAIQAKATVEKKVPV
jgi:DNA-binding NtrC family response regulator